MATRTTSMFMEETTLCAGAEPAPTNLPRSIKHKVLHHSLSPCSCGSAGRFFRRPEDAEDAAAEVFLKLHRVLETINQAVPFRPWVSQVAGRHCIDKLAIEENARKDSRVDGADSLTLQSPTIRLLRHSLKFCAGTRGSK